MRTTALFLAGIAVVAVATGSAFAQAGRYLAPPPIVLSPNLTDPWVMQLQPGNVPIYAMPQARSPRAWSAPPEAEARTARKIDPRSLPLAPEFLPQEVAYDGPGAPGSIVIDTVNRFLYLVEAGGTARRYGVGVGRPGFTWAGEHRVTRKAEWPDWHPPIEMRRRQPGLPVMMPGGPKNPLGARAMYLGSTLYRIHGTAEPWTIGHAVSSGCIRMRNEDVTDLYERVKVGTRVIVL
ncbi:L,D-transpeptidase [Pleomorphomonas diazotrophica]|uniref:L,D-transpeptidase n=1 Tax=Pleomorphomonas diazotrophica TaxID=1166257 RepID=A0A1I4TVS4_9HYPH|nr:L,D-transpeptidase [Pleomorphomonas diazotrophica]PKR87714.1 L,D-transpeptidase [Pleomorphomonas diazotrophica]SFM80759.1 Lipoprotein-anchoring transpeptidase ErfK/SrfK [Pleomorphomonas diazotrophica]